MSDGREQVIAELEGILGEIVKELDDTEEKIINPSLRNETLSLDFYRGCASRLRFVRNYLQLRLQKYSRMKV